MNTPNELKGKARDKNNTLVQQRVGECNKHNIVDSKKDTEEELEIQLIWVDIFLFVYLLDFVVVVIPL